MPRLFYPWGKASPPPYPSERRLGGPQSQLGCSGKEKDSLPCSCKESNHGHAAHRPVTTVTELPWLLLLCDGA